MLKLPLPISVLTDSYKAGHFAQYPDAKEMIAYGEFRAPFKTLEDDHRLVFTGIRYIVDNVLSQKWTVEDVEKADAFYSTHNAAFTPYPFPKDEFLRFIKENNGYFPVRIEAIAEGTAIYPHVPVYQITARGHYSKLVTFLETLLTMVWYPSTVATLSRRTRCVVEDAFEKSVDKDAFWKIDSRLHDFGFRGCTCLEQATIGGVAHLLNFRGSDTMAACYYAQYVLNNGKPIAQSIPATEHSVMTSWKNEQAAIRNMITKFGKGVFACVMDSYDYANAMQNILPQIKAEKLKQGGFMVCRPDSGDPTEAILLGLEAEEKCFGVTKNKKGFKVINGAGVIQGDGINIHNVKEILNAMMDKGYSAENSAFGMGSGLLQKVNRDTMSFATKLCHVKYADGTERDAMKTPKTDGGKYSLPGRLKVIRNKSGIPIVHCGTEKDVNTKDNLLKVVYDCGPVDVKWMNFDDLRDYVDSTYKALPKKADVIGDDLKVKITKMLQANKDRVANMKKK